MATATGHRESAKATPPARLGGVGTLLGILAGAALLRLAVGVGFANYDTLYSLVWGQQLSRLQTPSYNIPIAPTPHPLIEALGVVLTPLGPGATEQIAVWLGFVALAGCAYAVYRLGVWWFGQAAGILAALILITRMPMLSYGVRAYVDIPYLMFVLLALLVESRRPRAGTPVLVLLALGGLLRPEAWVFSGLYWLYLLIAARAQRSVGPPPASSHSSGVLDRLRDRAHQIHEPRSNAELAGLALVALSAPLIWILSDWMATGQPLWSLTNTRSTAKTLDRVTGIGKVPEYLPRRIGEILRPPILVGAALGGVLTLLWLRDRARLLALAGAIAVVVLGAFTAVGLPLDTRYAFLAAAILCVFCGAGVFGWTLLPHGDPRRRWWMIAGVVVLLGILAYIPAQYHSVDRKLAELARQETIENDLITLVEGGTISTRCEPVGVTNHAPIPLLALYLKSSPKLIETSAISSGTYMDPASKEVETDYILDPNDPHSPTPSIPDGFIEAGSNRSWLVFKHC
jgi:hypothetical protein